MMNTMDSHSQAFNSQRREQRHTDDGSTNTFLPPSSGNFLLPDHGQFTFSAEPVSMIDYNSMSGTTGQETTFTPNTASSFDSSLHPDVVNQTYPPTNAYMQAHSYSLSPNSHSRNGQSISPSHSVDHLSPEGGYMSDPSYQDFSAYTTPTFNGQYLDESFSQLNFTDHHAASQAFPPFQGEVNMSILASNTLATYNAQAPTVPSNARLDTHSQLLSPCPTSNSSPIVTDETARSATFPNVQYTGLDYNHSSTPPSRTAPPSHSTPIKQQQQQSPALTNSPSNMSLANPQPRATHLTSPIVRVENYGGRDSPSHSDVSRPMSKRSHGSRRSGNHLSPFPNDESSEDGDDDETQQRVRLQPVVRSATRNEDGSWMTSPASGQAGLTPDDREAMGDAWVPSLDEIAERRRKEDKKLDVHDWLSKSEVGSEAGDGGSSTNLLKPFTTRRRAKSTNDAHGRHAVGPGFGLGVRTDFDRIDDSNVPGPGLYIDVRSENDEESDDDDEVPESPPAEVSVVANQVDNEVSYFPPLQNGGILGAIVRPWVDVPSQQPPNTSTRYQPPTSSAAMMRFRIRAKDVESASLAATVGSRRLSESDLGSIRAAPGVIKAMEPDLKKQKDRQRRPSFLENILPTRKPTNLLKRKGSIPVQSQSAENVAEKPKEPLLEKPKRMGSWGRPKSPRLDTSVAIQGRDVGPPSSTGLTPGTGAWYHGAKNVIRRSRSRSDIGKSPGLAELMTQHGGPPMPMLASPLAETEATKPPAQQSPAGDDDDDDVQDAIIMNLEVRSDPIIPTPEGFKTHARQLNPRLTDYMVERITQEQVRRYKRLLEFKVKHRIAVESGACSSNSSSHKFCTELGGESKQLVPKAGNKDGEAPFLGFQVTAPGSDDDDGEAPTDGTLAAAGFPSGVPLPPVKRLPAEFECPLCFKVKKFYKPSDWTKHVHEDVQPFTCTFPTCGEPKSFKRKADWVRHENERHRQLEHWTCQIADCNHTCYRKDNFVQHLVREHKIPEPRQRTGKGATKEAPSNADTDDIWGLVARCRRDTTKQPKDEPCRFCGNICTSWKKLTVHLAKHMEQISMPILPLVNQKQISADTVISPVVEMPETRKLSATPNRSPVDNPSRYNPNSTLAPGIDPSYGQYPSDSPVAASTVMHTYPPPQMVPYKNPQEPVSNGNFANYAVQNNLNYSGRTYPGLQEPAKNRGAYINNLQIPSQSYLNGNMQNGVNRFPVTPVSAVGPPPPIFNTSPVDTTPFSTDTMASTYFTQEPQSMGSTGMTDLSGFDTTANPMQYQQPATYQDMAYMTAPQRNYQQYHGQ
ncbi:hypothetical protein BU23DRAFT_78863 [Bimuria novae-zelandiae CBS 107.79]|uniref:C2H2-type domain-containing protein n=1 Tax=Bimuria novae-zelandiae CBS 107.79 TaxID=1447943 RepID=A0A6A5VPC4_9PLEO|nr:hypothetical protein BU23DRAFT_78863 [Bimuria novae-zelandiae CBS 107.79]